MNDYEDQKFDKILLLDYKDGMLKVAKYAIGVAMALNVGIDIFAVLDKNKSQNKVQIILVKLSSSFEDLESNTLMRKRG